MWFGQKIELSRIIDALRVSDIANVARISSLKEEKAKEMKQLKILVLISGVTVTLGFKSVIFLARTSSKESSRNRPSSKKGYHILHRVYTFYSF